MSKYNPKEGIRPDLMDLEPDTSIYICEDILPTEDMATETQDVYYVPTATRATAETDRTAGDEPTRTSLASAKLEYTAGDISHGFELAEREIDNLGGIEIAEKVGGESAALTVWDKRETLTAAALFADAIQDAVGDTVDAQIRNALNKTMLCRGEYALVVSQTAKLALLDATSVQDRLANVKAAIPRAGEDAEISLLRALYGFGRILIGDDTYWTSGTKAAVVKLPPKRPLIYKSRAILGCTFTFCQNGHRIEVRCVDKPYKVCWDGLLKAHIALLNATGVCNVDLSVEDTTA